MTNELDRPTSEAEEENESVEAHQHPGSGQPAHTPEIGQLGRLLDDLFDNDQAEEDNAALCADCMSRLDLFVSDELDGLDVRRLHPELWEHLQACERCREEYDHLRTLVILEQEGGLLPPPPTELPRLPFLAPEPAPPPWRVEQSEQGDHLSLHFFFAPVYLQYSLIIDYPVPAHRGIALAGPTPILLLTDIIEVHDQQVVVIATARRSSEDTQTFDLDVAMVTELALAEAPTVILRWGDREYHAALDASGQTQFAGLPLDMLTTATDDQPSAAFSLSLEVTPVQDNATGD
ncbi:MAG: hypothetical protein QHJ81_12665 [Anaerolineae bacterium]|nr:hypothetical protein [Anaerolineae bacterium]